MTRVDFQKKEFLFKFLFIFLFASFIGRIYDFFLILGEGTLNYVKFFPTSVYTLVFSLPYGLAVLLVYFSMKILDKSDFFKSKYFLKVVLCVVIIDLVELLAGLFALRALGVMPWDYSHHIMNFMGLVSLPITIRWFILVGVFGKFACKKIDDFIEKPFGFKLKKYMFLFLILHAIYLLIRFVFENNYSIRTA